MTSWPNQNLNHVQNVNDTGACNLCKAREKPAAGAKRGKLYKRGKQCNLCRARGKTCNRCQARENEYNSPVYSCVHSDLVLDCKKGWG